MPYDQPGDQPMRRAPWYVVTGALAGFAAVISLHGQGAATQALPKPNPTSGTPKARGSAPAAPQSGGNSSAGSGGQSQPGRLTGVHSATGRLEPYGYGELSVKVTVNAGQITAVSVPILRTAEPYSQQLAQQVIPMLKSEVLAAHSARINGISGATYTSEAYATSLQSALDKLHLG
jgi:uncharacterized protein with FMN-binding domain